MDNMDWAKIFDTWKSTKTRRALPLELDDDEVQYAWNLNNFSASFYCIYSFNIVRQSYDFHIQYKTANLKFLFWWSVAKKFEWSVII